MFIFLDESGDLGFNFTNTKTSRYFIVTLLFAYNKRPLEKIVRKTFNAIRPNDRKRHCGVLHCTKETHKTRSKLFTHLSQKPDISIMSIKLNKQKVYTKLQNEKHILYNYVTNILLDRIFTRKLIPTNGTIELIASRRETNKFINENFEQYIAQSVNNKHKINLTVTIKHPCSEKGLQIVDAASWALFRKYEHNDESYYSLFKNLIVEERSLYE